MNTPSAKLLVLAADKFACIRISGRANFTSSIDFRTLVDELLAAGCARIVLELSDCLLMDSTFLGVLAGFGLKMNPAPDGQPRPAIELLNPNARITELLENLGVLHLFKFRHGPLVLPDGTEIREHEAVDSTKEEMTETSLDAHRTLMKINPENIARFKDVTAFLAEDLKKLKSKG